ncbi:hypothetical protein [Mycobacterium riyadhense]|uniref:hypothetical protein n=1 Tax=Mycobacterium riyadhense TaxID=486698 RepID=UPI0019514D14|nr:hypothetical protein [Mycobacterium riyadhense]
MASTASGGLVRALNFEPDNRKHGLKRRELDTGQRSRRATEMKDTSGNPVVNDGSETYRRC